MKLLKNTILVGFFALALANLSTNSNQITGFDVKLSSFVNMAYAQCEGCDDTPEDPEHNDRIFGDPYCSGDCDYWTYKSDPTQEGENYGGYSPYSKYCQTSSDTDVNVSTSGFGGQSSSEGYYVEGCGYNRNAKSGSSCWDQSC